MFIILSQSFWWQKKEYRWDRFRTHLFENKRSKFSFFAYLIFLLLTILTILMAGRGVAVSLWFAWGLLGAGLVFYFASALRRGVFRPDFTLKASTLLFLNLTFLLGVALLSFTVSARQDLFWIIVVSLWPLVLAGLVALNNIPYAFKKSATIKAALRMREKRPATRAVGITGSFGKTSTKFFLEQILAQAGVGVAATKDRRNAVYPVAADMLEQLPKSPAVYIAEMGAYRQGEIAELCELVQPEVVVLTAISNQHLALFGSLEKLKEAKWEIVAGLPENGVAVLNADDPNIVDLAERSDAKKIWFSMRQELDVAAYNVKYGLEETETTIKIGEETAKVTLPLLGQANLSNIVAAAAAAFALGVEPKRIFAVLPKLKTVSRTMEIRSGKNGVMVIDDSYSANEQGVLVALAHLETAEEKKKIVVYQPIIELGEEQKNAEKKIMQALEYIDGEVYIASDFRPKKLAKEVSGKLDSDTVVLLEGRVPEIVRQEVLG